MANEFEQGSVVRLKSGSPMMTIVDMNPNGSTGKAVCQWFSKDNEIQVHTFPLSALELDENTGPFVG